MRALTAVPSWLLVILYAFVLIYIVVWVADSHTVRAELDDSRLSTTMPLGAGYCVDLL
jgi:hypothetical protein